MFSILLLVSSPITNSRQPRHTFLGEYHQLSPCCDFVFPLLNGLSEKAIQRTTSPAKLVVTKHMIRYRSFTLRNSPCSSDTKFCGAMYYSYTLCFAVLSSSPAQLSLAVLFAPTRSTSRRTRAQESRPRPCGWPSVKSPRSHPFHT